MVVVKGEDWGKWGETGQKIQTFSYEMNIFWRSTVEHDDYR